MPTESVQQRAAVLRRRAEARVQAMEYTAGGVLSPEEAARLVHELRVHQIELEMQNEELVRAQVELDALRARYFDLYHLAPVGYLTLSEKGLILEANLRAASLLGLPSKTLVKRPLSRFFFPEDADLYYRCRRQLFRTGQPQACELRLAPRPGSGPLTSGEALTGGGPLTWVRLEMMLAQDEQEQATVCRAILDDISARKHAELALRANENRYRDLYENAPVAYFSVGTDGRILRCNRQAAQMLGATIEQLVGRPVFDLYPDNPHGKAKARQVFQHFLAGESVLNEELQMVREDGTPVWIDLSVTAIRDAAGQVVESRSAVLDITERKRAAEALRVSEERYRMLLMLSPDGVSVTDQTGRILACNEQFARMYGFDRSAEVIGRHAQELARPEAFAELHDEVAAALARGESLIPNVEVEVLRRDGSSFFTEYSIAPVPWPDAPHGVAYLSNIRDITKRKATAAELEQHRLHLGELVAARTAELHAEIAERTAAQAALERSEACLRAAEHIAHIGTLERDLATNQIYWTPGLYDVYGIPVGTPPDVGQVLARKSVHPDDDIFIQAAIDRAILAPDAQECTYRVILPSGETRMILGTVEAVRDAAGQPVLLRATAQDITRQAALQTALQRGEANLRVAERLAHMGSWELDPATGEYQASDEVRRIFNFGPEVHPITVADIDKTLHPDDRAAVQAERQYMLQSGQQGDIQYRIVLPGGEVRVVHVRAEVHRDAAGLPTRMIGMTQDVTEQEQIKEALTQRVQELSSLQDLGRSISFVHPLEEIINISLQRLVDLAGFDLAQLFLLREGRLHFAGVSTNLAKPPAQARCLNVGECLCGLAVQNGQPVYAADLECDPRVTLKHCHANGLHSLVALPLRSGEAIIGALAIGAIAPDAFADRLPFLETVAGLVAVRLQNVLLLQEVRERAAGLEEIVLERTRELQAERDRTHAILETVGESVVVTDLDGQLLFLNPATTALTGYVRDEDLGQPLWRDWTPQARAEIWPAAQAALRSGQAWHGEISGRRQDGALYIAALTGAPLYDPDAAAGPVAAVWAQRDITAQKEAARLKDQFVSNVSHELRTPISIITLACDNLEAFWDRLEESQRQDLMHDIQEQAGRLSSIVADTLQVSQIDAGRVPAARSRVDLARLVREEADSLRLLAGQHGQHLNIAAAEAVDIVGHETQLRQIVRNLLDNAMKYTPAGRQISCICETRVRAPGDIRGAAPLEVRAWAVVEIADEGIGIAAKDLPYVFERFFRANGELHAPGTGLGLPIAKELVALHGGWISVASTLGEGSTFTVYLPLAEEEP